MCSLTEPICPKITKEERKALQYLRENDNCMVLTEYKRVVLVVIAKNM